MSRVRLVRAQRAQQAEAVELRHHHVGDHQVGRAAGAPPRAPRGRCAPPRRSSASPQQAPHVVAHVGVVVGQDDARRAIGRSRAPRRRPRRPRPRGGAPVEPALRLGDERLRAGGAGPDAGAADRSARDRGARRRAAASP